MTERNTGAGPRRNARSSRSLADLAHFDRLYRLDDDPWCYEQSQAEAFKRRAVLAALGSGLLGNGCELGCGPGVATAAMASRFATLTAIDGSAEAVRLASRRTARYRNVTVQRRALPSPLPHRAYDVVIATETLYYLRPTALNEMLRAIRRSLRPGGQFVSTHAIGRFDDAATSGLELVHRQSAVFGSPVRTIVGASWRLELFQHSAF